MALAYLSLSFPHFLLLSSSFQLSKINRVSSSLRVLQHTAPFSLARQRTFPIVSLLAVSLLHFGSERFSSICHNSSYLYQRFIILTSADALIFSPSASPCSVATGYNCVVNFTENEVDMVIYSYHSVCVCVSLWKHKREILEVLYCAKITLWMFTNHNLCQWTPSLLLLSPIFRKCALKHKVLEISCLWCH